jgi:uncharacterized repeat protein (TIGR03803 family)
MTDLNLLRNLAAFTCACFDSLTKRVFLPVLIVSLNLLLTARATAQTFTTLHSFTALDQTYYTNGDGRYPSCTLVLSGNVLYGTASGGGSSGNGTVFAVNTNGTGFTNLHSFTASDPNIGTNTDGTDPSGRLILSGNTLYGTAETGGNFGHGTVFAVNTNGTGFTTLHNFTAFDPDTGTNSDGFWPLGGLVLSGNTLYGTTYGGGSSGSGTVFAINTNGTDFRIVHNFTGSDGGVLVGLILSGNTLYGTAEQGGSSGGGTVFAVNTDGTGFTNLYNFTAGSGSWPNITNSDGAVPSGVALSGNTLYGAADLGGSSGSGTLFALNTDGTGFTNLHDFNGSSDGVNPGAGLILSGNTLYGTAYNGGTYNNGTVFAVNTDGTGFTKLHSFTSGSAGAHPIGGLILSGNTLFGTAFGGYNSGGDFSGNGTVFSITLPSPPQLRIIRSAGNVILSWPTNAAGLTFTLQSTTNLISAAGWNTVSPVSAVVSGQNTVTNPITGTQQFYRLSQ